MTAEPGAIPCVAVVPVFVNAGAAILPAVVAWLATVVAPLLRPREFIRLCRTRPLVPVAVLACIAALYFGGSWLLGPAAARSERKAAPSGRTDWAQVAIAILQDEERAKALGSMKPPAPAPHPAPSPVGAAQPAIYRGDASRCGFGGGRAPLALAPLWEFTRENAMCLSSPVVVGDALYAATCVLDPFTNYGAVFCLDAASGRPRWVAETFKDSRTGKEREFNGFFSSPAVSADGRCVVIGQGLHADANCALVCLDAAAGRVLWTVDTPLHVESSPAIEGDVVVAGAGAIEVGADYKVQGNPGFVFAVRLSDGRKLWEYPVNDPESSPAIRDGVAYIGSGLNGSALVALRIAADEELKGKNLDRLVWKVPTPFPATGTVTLADDLVLVGCGNGDYVFTAKDPKGAVLAFDRATGVLRWQVEVSDAVLGPIAVRGGTAVCAVRSGEVIAIDMKASGGPCILWRRRAGGKVPVLAGPAFTGRLVYAVSQDGYLAVLDAADGTVLERHSINAKGKPGEMGLSLSSPFVADGRLYVGSETGGLRCFIGKEAR